MKFFFFFLRSRGGERENGVSVDVEEISATLERQSLPVELTRCTANCLVGSSTSIRIFRSRSSGRSERVNWAEAATAISLSLELRLDGGDGTARVAVASGVEGVSGAHSAAFLEPLSASEREDFTGGVDSSIVARL